MYARSRSETLGCTNQLRRCAATGTRAVGCGQNTKSAICCLVDANIVRENLEQVESILDPSKTPFRGGEQLGIPKASYSSY